MPSGSSRFRLIVPAVRWMHMIKANLFNIQKFSIHDGPGIRTVVFFKGCPLSCIWCANPESQKTMPELYCVKTHCIGCGACIRACQHGALAFGNDGIEIDRSKCNVCGDCVSECYSRALQMKGEGKTIDEIFREIEKDSAFYANSGGGYTLSGGEPLLQDKFCLKLVDRCKRAGFHGAIETSGFGGTQNFKKLAGMLDLVFYDMKEMDDKKHRSLTGFSNELILQNLYEIQEDAKEIIVRTPVIPGKNDSIENITKIAELCNKLEKVQKWELLPYHKLGEYKYESLGRGDKLGEMLPPDKNRMEQLAEIANSIMSHTGKVCVINTSTMG